MVNFLTGFFLFLVPWLSLAQQGSDTGRFVLPVSPKTTNTLAWTGGLNAVQFCELDLDRDGTLDLLAFDRHGNRIIPLVYRGTSGSTLYQPDTSYISRLPALHDWVITADYNCDGRMDLFTYGLGGIRVFRNISQNELRFEPVTNMLTSWFYTGYIGILVTPVDYPAIADIDGDGDLDLLTFFGLGSFVEYHKNLSMEKYGTCDSLDFMMSDNCWGKFRESEGSNKITLNADCPASLVPRPSSLVPRPSSHVSRPTSHLSPPTSDVPRPSSDDKHTGSTLLVMDLNGDNLKDLVLGDVDFPNLIALFNGGTADSAFIVAFDTLFPSNSLPVSLFDFPVPSCVDLDHDGLKDLLVSSFNPRWEIPDNYESVWYYRNTGTSTLPEFMFRAKRLFQEQMIDVGSGSYPLFADLDQDGLTDMLVGCWGRYDSSYYFEGVLKSVNTGRISFYRNTREALNPTFSWITDDLAGLSSLKLTGLSPACEDLSGDGSPDLIIGQDDGTLIYLENKNTGSIPPDYFSPVLKYQGIDVGESSTPQLFDFDSDGLSDLIIGEKNGNLNYYRNTGTQSNPTFSWVTDSLGKINVTNYQTSYSGYSAPFFFLDSGGQKRLLVGSEEGKIWYVDDIPAEPEARYTESSELYTLVTGQPFPVRCGWRTTPSIARMTDSTRFDLVTGNWAGGLNYFSLAAPPDILLGDAFARMPGRSYFRVFPNPSGEEIRISLPQSGESGNLSVHIFNHLGQSVCCTGLPDAGSISIRHLPDGLYLITLADPAGRRVFSPQKLIIRH